MIKTEELSIVERFRESYHSLARMVAADMTTNIIRQQTGISHRRLRLLLADPSFNELIAIYRKRIDEKWNENIDRYLDLGMSNMIRAEALIQDRLEEEDEDGVCPVPTMLLDRISQGRADRFGYSKNSTLRVEHDFAASLDRAIARSGKDPKLIEGRANQSEPLLVLERPRAENPPRPDATPSASQPPRKQVSMDPLGNLHLHDGSRSFVRVLEAPIKRRKVA